MPGTTSSVTSSSRGKLIVRKKTHKGSGPKDMCMHKVAHEVSIGVTKDEIYSSLDVWNRYVGLLSKLMLQLQAAQDTS